MPDINSNFYLYLRDAVSCLSFLIGIGVGAWLLSRKKRRMPGLLTMAGFGLFGLNQLASLVIYSILFSTVLEKVAYDFQTMARFNTAFALAGAVFTLLGSAALIAALVSFVRSGETE